MATLSKLKKKVVDALVDFGDGDVIKLQMTPYSQGEAEARAFSKQLEETEDDEVIGALVHGRFIETIQEWDFEDDQKPQLTEGDAPLTHSDSSPRFPVIPLTHEGLKDANVPPALLTDILIKGYEYLNAKKLRRK